MRFDVTRNWYSRSFRFITCVLLPFSWLFLFITVFRRWLYRVGIFKSFKFSVPIIIVGNIAVGGTGKTPMVIWLAQYLTSLGYKPGIVTRGYGGHQQTKPYEVKATSSVAEVGDEAMLLVNRSGCPVVVGVDRVAAVKSLLSVHHCDVIISDDGLQHYRLVRDIEIAVIDGERRSGNGYLLPAGPLREPESRLREVDFVIVNGGQGDDKFTLSLVADKLVSVLDAARQDLLENFPARKVHAVAGIGNPGRFFKQLKLFGFELVEHVFPDHHLYRANDLQFNDALPIVMTEKDAVKCVAFADERYWYLPVTAKVNKIFQEELSAKLKLMESNNETESDFSKHSCRVHHVHQHDAAGKSDG